MTDWERVDHLRSKGLSWEEIAEDKQVGFTPPDAVTKPGLALKALYFQRRSRSRRAGAEEGEGRGGSAGKPQGEGSARKARKRRAFSTTAFVGILLALGAVIPWLISFEFPVLTAVLPALYLVLAAVAGVVLVGLAFVAVGTRALRRWRRAAILGVVVGLLVAAVLAFVTTSFGCPNLATSSIAEPSLANDGTWDKDPNPAWKSGGVPVFFFYGSTACPFCSASSWALRGALQAFGTLSGWTYGNSDPSDTYGDGSTGIPEIRLDSATLTSPYLSMDVVETTGAHVTYGAVSCPESAYVSAYDGSSGIPFVVVGGSFIHTGSFVDPGCLTTGGCGCNPTSGGCGTDLSYQQVESDLASGSGPIASAIDNGACYLEAYIVVADSSLGVAPPASVASNGCVSPIVTEIEAAG